MNRKHKRTIATVLTTAALTVPITAGTAIAYGHHTHSDAANWAVDNGIMQGDEDHNLNLNDPLTRGQAATILYRYHTNCHTRETRTPACQPATN